MNNVDHVWANSPANIPSTQSSSLWLSTLVDVASQWGWLFGIIAVSCLVTLAFGDHQTKEN